MMTTRCLHCGVQYAIAAPDQHSSLNHELVCGQCGHPLEVATGNQPEATPSQAAAMPFTQEGTAPVPWLVRQLSGSVFAPSNQATLERWIRQGRVSRDDLLSQDGTTWQRLGNIVELAPLFGESDPPIPSKSNLRPVTGPQPALSTPAAQEHFVSQAMAGPPPVAQPSTVSPPEPQQPAALRPTAVMPRVAAQPASPSFFLPQSVSLREERAGRPTGPRTTKTRNTDEAFDEDSDEPTIFAFPSGAERDDGHAMRAGHRGSRWTFVFCLAIGIAAAGTYVAQPPWLNRAISALRRAPVPHAVVAEVGRGYQALDKDSMTSLSQAMDAFTRAGRMDYRFADAPAGLAETELAIAEQFNQAADDLGAFAQGQPKRERLRMQADANKQRDEAARHAERALTLAKEALALAPESVPANRALALYYGVRGAPDKMEQPLKRAKAAAPQDARVLYAAGLAALGQDPNAAHAAFAAAVQADPNFNRALYRLARLEADQKQFKEAGPRIEQILTTAQDHTLAQALLQVVEPAAHAKAQPPPTLAFEAPNDPSQGGASPTLTTPPAAFASNTATPLAVATPDDQAALDAANADNARPKKLPAPRHLSHADADAVQSQALLNQVADAGTSDTPTPGENDPPVKGVPAPAQPGEGESMLNAAQARIAELAHHAHKPAANANQSVAPAALGPKTEQVNPAASDAAAQKAQGTPGSAAADEFARQLAAGAPTASPVASTPSGDDNAPHAFVAATPRAPGGDLPVQNSPAATATAPSANAQPSGHGAAIAGSSQSQQPEAPIWSRAVALASKAIASLRSASIESKPEAQTASAPVAASRPEGGTTPASTPAALAPAVPAQLGRVPTAPPTALNTPMGPGAKLFGSTVKPPSTSKVFAPEQKPAAPQTPKLAAADVPAVVAAPKAPSAQTSSAADTGAPIDQLLDKARQLHDQHRPADALPLYEAVTHQAPSNVSGYIGMGWCQLELNDPPSARKSFERALHVSPRLADAHFGLAEALRAENERREAVKQYRQYLSIEPGGRMAQLARQDIEDLSK